MSIRHFSGEYLVGPSPIHMGLNWCSHGCYYCFANLNRPERRADYTRIRQFIDKVGRGEPGKDIAAWLACKGYPILASNDSDPFAKSNGEQNLVLMENMLDMGLRFVFQTRGGDRAVEFLRKHPPTMVYISFTTDQEEVRKTREPGAPSFEARKELALACKEAGHFVIAGLNPFYAPWWDDIEGFVAWLAGSGINHAWVGDPHLNYQQVRAMPSKTQTRFGLEIESFKTSRNMASVGDLCLQHGVNPFTGVASIGGDFWKPYFDLGYPFFPTLDEWFTRLRAMGQPVAFTFEAFHEWANVFGDFESSAFKEYLTGIGRSLRNAGDNGNAKTAREVHEYLWRVMEFPTRMRHDDIFIGTQDGNIAVDDEDRPLLVYATGIEDPERGRYDIDECEVVLGLDDQEG